MHSNAMLSQDIRTTMQCLHLHTWPKHFQKECQVTDCLGQIEADEHDELI